MSFLSAAFLMALPLVAAPLVLHWFDRRRNRVIEWGAMEFLIEASARKSSARRLKQWLLLLLRCLAIAALVFALARPLLPAGYLGGHHRGETILVIDNSMSMMRKTASGTMMDSAIEDAVERLSRLPRGEEVRVLTAAPYPVWSGAGSVNSDGRAQDFISAHLKQLQPTLGRSDLLAALFAAVQAESDPTLSSRRIVVLTDGQAADWNLDDESGWKRFQESLQAFPVRTEVETVWLDRSQKRSSISNVAIDRLSLSRSIIGVGQPVTVTAHIHNYDPSSSAASPVVWQVDETDQYDEMVDAIEGGQSCETNWVQSFDTPGTYRLSCRIDRDDELSADNQSSLVVEVIDRIPILIVEDAFELAEMQQDSYFVQAALGWINGVGLDEKSIYVPTVVSPAELATSDLSSQRVVVIPNLTRLDDNAVTTLTEFVSDGGGLWIGLGPRTDVNSFNHQLFAEASGLSPIRIDRIVDSDASEIDETLESEPADTESASERRVHIDPFRSNHPATRQLADDKQLDLADAMIQRRFEFVTGDNPEKLSVLLSLHNGQPLAAENFVGRGRVIVQAVPLRLQWSDLARTQSFVVMVRDWIDYLAQPRATQFNLQPGEPIVMRMPTSSSDTASTMEDSPTALLTTPQGDAIELTAQRNDDTFVFRSSRTRLPGEYKLEIGLADQTIPFHVQRDIGESDLSPLTSVAERQIAASTIFAPTKEDLSESISTQSDPLWPYLLLVLIVLITGELILSGALSRERFGSAGIPEFSEMDSPLLGSTTSDNNGGQSGSTAIVDSLVSPMTSEVN